MLSRFYLLRAARIFRQELSVSERPDYMGKFPAGWCGFACSLLGAYFFERGGKSVRYICGERRRLELEPGYGRHYNPYTHAWLVVDSYIVDITADQFQNEIKSPVIVKARSAWHLKWKVRQDDEINSLNEQDLTENYRRISALADNARDDQ